LNEVTSFLPHLNAALNGLATILLLVGLWLIKTRREKAHKWVMIACFGVSAAFLVSYLTYHFTVELTRLFPRQDYPLAAVVYYVILLTHVLLAMTVPFLALASIWLVGWA
jgi:putative membrane protein